MSGHQVEINTFPAGWQASCSEGDFAGPVRESEVLARMDRLHHLQTELAKEVDELQAEADDSVDDDETGIAGLERFDIEGDR